MPIFTVTNTNDSGAGSLRDAIAAANSGDTIQFDASLAGQTITLTSGQLAIDKNLTIDGSAASGITLSGNNASRVVDVQGSYLNVTLRGLTIANGRTTTNGVDGAGAGIRTANNTTLTLENSTLRNNYASGEGGGGLYAGNFGNTTVTNSTFTNNQSAGRDQWGNVGERGGGAIAIASESSLSVTGSTFNNNSGINGGAINTVLSTLSVSDSTFTNNDTTAGGAFGPDTRGYGGAIYTDGGKTGVNDSITISNSRFDGNKGAGQGGALFLYAYSGHDSVVVQDSTIVNSSLVKDTQNLSLGGGLRVGGGGGITLTNTTVANNRAIDQGGGLWAGEGSPISINNSTFYGNRAESVTQGLGGAMLLSNNPPTTITDSTIANNYAGFQGGGFWGGGSATTLANTLVTGNQANNGGNSWNIYHNTGTTFNDGGGNVEYNPYNAGDTKVVPGGTFVDPQLAPFVDNGTALQIPPQPGNAAVTAGAETTGGTAPTAPLAPSNLVATANSQSEIALTWTDNSNNESGFNVERSLDNTNWTTVATTTANATSYTDTSLTGNTQYYYRLSAVNGVGSSTMVTADALTPVPTAPLAPTNLVATPTNETEIALTWSDNSNNEAGFIVERSLDNTNWTTVTTTTANATSYTDTGLTPNTQYYYRLSAGNEVGNSSTVAADALTPTPTAPLAPSNLVANPTSETEIALSWADNSNNEAGFSVERSLDNTNWTSVATTAANATSYTDTGLTANTQYYYRLSAVNGVGNSTTVTADALTPATPIPTAPLAPSNLVANPTSETEIALAWADNSNNETGFTVERSLDNSNWTTVATTAADATSYTDTGLTANTQYYYRLSAVNGTGSSNLVTADALTPNPGTGGNAFALDRGSNNIFTLNGEVAQLQFALKGTNTQAVNEVGAFKVDDDQGTVNGIAPGQDGYLQAALSNSKVIFSALPKIFPNVSTSRQISFNPGDKLGFYLVQNGTTDKVLADLAAGRTPSNVFFSTKGANPGGSNVVQVSDLANSAYRLAWEDGFGGTTDFSDLEMTVELAQTPPPVGTALQGGQQAEVIDLTNLTGSVSAQFTVNSSAAYQNSFGFYAIDDSTGRIGNLNPSDPGYAQTAVSQRIDLNAGLPGGKLLSPFLIANGTAEDFLSKNPGNQPGSAPNAYFAHIGANPDGVDHIRLLGDNTLAFEDLYGGGDLDYNDYTVQVNFA